MNTPTHETDDQNMMWIVFAVVVIIAILLAFIFFMPGTPAPTTVDTPDFGVTQNAPSDDGSATTDVPTIESELVPTLTPSDLDLTEEATP
jgi:hypothetical protein